MIFKQNAHNNLPPHYKSALKDFSAAKHFAASEHNYAAKKSRSSKIKRAFFTILTATTIVTALFAQQAYSASRIKDIVYFEGIRDNTLLGYGLVVGLNGTGDNLKNSPFTEKGLETFLSKLGISSGGTNLKTKNVAAVTLTAKLPAFSRTGSKFDIAVSTLGDAKSLEGGILLASPLLGADGNVYAVAQGAINVGGLITKSNSSNATSKGVPTSGLIANGAVVEREIEFELSSMKSIKLALRNPDISTARRISENINDVIGQESSAPIDPGTVQLTVPEIYESNVIGLLADIEQIIVEPDQIARVVVDEASGTIVMGEEVKIDTIAVAQGNLMVSINNNEEKVKSQFTSDLAESSNDTHPVNKNKRAGNGLAVLRQGANLRDLVSGLNALGVGTRDLITILETIKVAGALHADIEVR